MANTAMDVAVETVQVLNGYGYVTQYPVARMVRDAKLTLYEGTNEIRGGSLAAASAVGLSRGRNRRHPDASCAGRR